MPIADGDVTVLRDVHALHTPARGHREVALGDVPGALEIAGEDAYAVAAHLRDGAVAVAVVHEPLGLLGQVPGLGVLGGPYDVEQAVPTDAGPTVAQRGDGGGGQVEGVLGVRDDHEVVLGAVALEEGDPGAHPSIVRERGLSAAGRWRSAAGRWIPVGPVDTRWAPAAGRRRLPRTGWGLATGPQDADRGGLRRPAERRGRKRQFTGRWTLDADQ
ncbi:hypothetical protein M2160_002348 [Streptomyces sp. SAI-117]|nr:hypothetical protein [Streptomyces sp. SAI-117]